jgi:BASS family bile acid:Na+ symporter
VAAPAFALIMAATTSAPTPIRFALVAMSVAPLPPILPFKQAKAGGEEDYAIGLLVAASLASILVTPPLVAAATRLLDAHATVSAARLATTLLLSIGLPLGAGMALRAVSEPFAQSFGRFAQRAGFLLLLVLLAVMIAAAGREMLSLLGNGSALLIAATVAFGLIVGHIFGGRNKAALALAVATRHPGVALAIAEMSFPDQRKPITAAILLYLLVTAIVTAPYVRWISNRPAAPEDRSGP